MQVDPMYAASSSAKVVLMGYATSSWTVMFIRSKVVVYFSTAIPSCHYGRTKSYLEELPKKDSISA